MIYLDHNATTPVLPEVFEAMAPYFCQEWGNPSSTYRFGSRLKTAIGNAREQVANLIGAMPDEILFTSCGTESNNSAIHSALLANPKKRHIITSAVEHSSILAYCRALEKQGYKVTYLPVDREGLLNPADLEIAITKQTAVVSLMWANNETGVLFPAGKIAEICRRNEVLFHCDAVQAVGKVPIDVKQTHADYLSMTGHKFNAPKGVGALYVRRTAPYSPLICGGHQESGRRGGTENVPLIIGIGKAAQIASQHIENYDKIVRGQRDALEATILARIPNAERNGHKSLRIANTSNISFLGVQSDALLMLLDQSGICASSGSACLADSQDTSHVISAMKPDRAAVRENVRFSLAISSASIDMIDLANLISSAVEALQT